MQYKYKLYRPAALACVTLLLCGAQGIAQNAALKLSSPKTGAAAAAVSAPVPLAYEFTPGSVTHFKVSAFFDGHFPPFAQPDSPPVHFKAELATRSR